MNYVHLEQENSKPSKVAGTRPQEICTVELGNKSRSTTKI